MMRPIYIAVCGASVATDAELDQAEATGRLLAESQAVVVTGGLGGVMAAAAKGATLAGGIAIGVLPSDRPEDGNEYNSVVVATGLGEARNVVVVNAADAVIAVGGEFGTLSEIALALRSHRPVVGLSTWELTREGVEVHIPRALDAQEAVRLTLEAVRA